MKVCNDFSIIIFYFTILWLHASHPCCNIARMALYFYSWILDSLKIISQGNGDATKRYEFIFFRCVRHKYVGKRMILHGICAVSDESPSKRNFTARTRTFNEPSGAKHEIELEANPS